MTTSIYEIKASFLLKQTNYQNEQETKCVSFPLGNTNQKALQSKLSVACRGQQGLAEAEVAEQKALAKAKGVEKKLLAEASGIEQKALAMQKLDGVGKEHEEFKLRLQQQTEIQLAKIGIQQHIAEAQAKIMAEAFKSANIEIVGGEQQFFDSVGL